MFFLAWFTRGGEALAEKNSHVNHHPFFAKGQRRFFFAIWNKRRSQEVSKKFSHYFTSSTKIVYFFFKYSPQRYFLFAAIAQKWRWRSGREKISIYAQGEITLFEIVDKRGGRDGEEEERKRPWKITASPPPPPPPPLPSPPSPPLPLPPGPSSHGHRKHVTRMLN